LRRSDEIGGPLSGYEEPHRDQIRSETVSESERGWARAPNSGPQERKSGTVMINLGASEVWFVCGSQHLYGPGPLQRVAADGREIAGALAESPKLPLKTVFKA